MNNLTENSFAHKLRHLRKKAGKTQAELAFLIGVHEMTIRRWEKSQSTPTLEFVKKIAQVLNVPEETLFSNKTHSITVNFYWEVDDNSMNLMTLHPDTFSFGYRNDGQVLLSGAFDFNMSVDAIMDQIRAEIVAAKAGKEARDKALKNLKNRSKTKF